MADPVDTLAQALETYDREAGVFPAPRTFVGDLRAAILAAARAVVEADRHGQDLGDGTAVSSEACKDSTRLVEPPRSSAGERGDSVLSPLGRPSGSNASAAGVRVPAATPEVEVCAQCDGTGCPCLRARDWQSIENGCGKGCPACGLNACAQPDGKAFILADFNWMHDGFLLALHDEASRQVAVDEVVTLIADDGTVREGRVVAVEHGVIRLKFLPLSAGVRVPAVSPKQGLQVPLDTYAVNKIGNAVLRGLRKANMKRLRPLPPDRDER